MHRLLRTKEVHFGVLSFLATEILKHSAMTKRPQMRRLSVSPEPNEFAELRLIAQASRPPLSIQFVARYALQGFLDEHRGKQLQLLLNKK
jgi:hypothetical protein